MKKNLMSGLIFAGLMALTPAVFAGNGNDKKGKNEKTEIVTNTNGNIDVQYIGEADGAALLMVKLIKSDNKVGYLRIFDDHGELLHTERVLDSSYSRYIKVFPEEISSFEVSYLTSEGIGKKRYNLELSFIEAFRLSEVAVK